jgi:hypothetical protein
MPKPRAFLSTVEMARVGPVKVHGDDLDQTGRYLLRARDEIT